MKQYFLNDTCFFSLTFLDVLIRKQCLPVGLDERLEFFIPDVPGCLPTFMTVTVEPTAST